MKDILKKMNYFNKKIVKVVLTLTMVLSVMVPGTMKEVKADGANYLTFTAEENGSWVKFSHLNTATTIKYSLDGGQTWQNNDIGPYTGMTLIEGIQINLNKGQSVCFKGNERGQITTDGDYHYHFSMGGKIAGSGDVTSLVNGVGGDVELAKNAFNGMFYGCTALITPPKLPSTTIGDWAYCKMFYGCTGLTTLPQILVTNAGAYAFADMFANISNISNIIKTNIDTDHGFTQQWKVNPTNADPSKPATADMFRISNFNFDPNHTYYCYNPHTHGNGTRQNGQAATCTEDGWIEYYKCSCGKYFTEAACTHEITNLDTWKTTSGKKVMLGHNWSFTSNDETITATCSRDASHTATLSLSAEDKDYSGSAYVGAFLNKTTWESFNIDVPKINYEGITPTTYEKFETAPTNVGKYKAEVSVVDGNNTYTLEKNFEIKKINPVLDNLAYTAPGNLVYSGSAKSASVSPKTGVTGLGSITVKYYNSEGIEVPSPTNVGTYKVKVLLAAGDNYNAVTTELEVNTFEITPKPVKVSGIIAKDKMYDGNSTATLNYDNVSFAGIEDGDSLTVTATGTFVDSNGVANSDVVYNTNNEVAKKTVKITDLTLDGDSKDNYALATDGNQTSAEAKINQCNSSEIKVTLDQLTFEYDETNIEGYTVPVTLKYLGTTLVEGKDYEIVKKEGVATNFALEPGKYTLEVKLKGNYSGTITRDWSVNKVVGEKKTIELDETTYNGLLTVTTSANEIDAIATLNNPLSALTEDELQDLKSGKVDIDVILTVDSKEIDKIQDKSYEEMMKAVNNTKNIRFLDISIDKVLNYKDEHGDVINIETKPVRETTDEVEITIDVPSSISRVASGYSRKYTIIRSHLVPSTIEGEEDTYDVAKLTAVQKGKTLTFKTNLFSDYAVMYVDTLIPIPAFGSDTGAYIAPNTGVTNSFKPLSLLPLALATALIVIKRKED